MVAAPGEHQLERPTKPAEQNSNAAQSQAGDIGQSFEKVLDSSKHSRFAYYAYHQREDASEACVGGVEYEHEGTGKRLQHGAKNSSRKHSSIWSDAVDAITEREASTLDFSCWKAQSSLERLVESGTNYVGKCCQGICP